MKSTKQWTGAVIILAAMVFVLTFAMNYLGGKSKTEEPVQQALQLTFRSPSMPQEMPPPRTEEHQSAHWNFWFENRNDRDVKIGLLGKLPRCKCLDVELFLLPESHAPLLALPVAGRVGLLAGNPLAPLGASLTDKAAVLLGNWGSLPVQGQGAVEDSMAADAVGKDLKGVPVTEESETTVPAGARGWVRLHWLKENATSEPLEMVIYLWTDAHNNQNILTAKTEIVAPLMLKAEEEDLGELSLRDLPRQVPVYFYSMTRGEMDLKVEVYRNSRKAESDPFQVGVPTRLTLAEKRRLLPHGDPVMSVYKMMVALGDRSPDGTTPFDMGSFQRYITVACKGEEAHTTKVMAVRGRVTGEVSVGTSDGMVNFGPFDPREGSRRVINLETDVPGVELAVDKDRVPSFLAEPKLEGPEVVPGGSHRVWRLTLRVPPGQAVGRFPDPGVEGNRDAAVYIQVKRPEDATKVARLIRIPMMGVANSR
jgi:hypothetical protein